MNDTKTTIKQLKEIVDKFIDEREWAQFHSPKNCSMDIAIEAAELMELFQWCDNKDSYNIAQNKISDVQDELADIIMGVLCFARSTNIDITQALIKKLEKTARNYPIDKAKGKNCKYTDFS